MKNKYIILIMCIITILLAIGNISASDVDDTTITNSTDSQKLEKSNDDLINTTESELVSSTSSGTFKELQTKINLAESGSTITLDKDYTYDGKTSEIGIIIGKSLTINGNGHTLNGLSKSRILLILYNPISNNKVVLNNVKFVNGNSSLYGGAIYNYGDLTVNKCVFTNNYAKYCGGAINSVGNLKCTNSIFNKNTANGDGGAILSLSFSKSELYYHGYYGNTTAKGNLDFLMPFILNYKITFKTEQISDCTFTNNIAKGRGGGAVYGYGGLIINRCKFNSNKAGEMGGAIFGNKDLIIKNSKFSNNKAPLYGGAVYFKCHEQSGSYVNGRWVSTIVYYSCSIKSSTFTKNTANNGGAIYGFVTSTKDKTHSAKVVKCTFAKNKAKKNRDTYGTVNSKCVFNYLKLTLKTVNVKKSAKKLVLTAVFKKGKTYIKNKKLTFKFNGKTYKAKTNKKGIGKVIVKKSVLSKLKVGKKVKYQVKYGSLLVKKTAKVKK